MGLTALPPIIFHPPFMPQRTRVVYKISSRQPVFSSVQIQPMNVRTRKGYAKNGSGEAVGKTCSPQKILAAVMAKRTAPMTPISRIQIANSLGILVSRRAADHKAV